MRELAWASDVGLVVMHMRGKPKTMQDDPTYENVVEEVESELLDAARKLLSRGVAQERICLDVGIGFGKRPEHNQALVAASARFAELGYPVLAAVSRKSFIGAAAGIAEPNMRDRASALCAAFMMGCGAQIARVHDVELTREVLRTSRRAVIGMGSNLGNTSEYLDEALDDMRRNENIWVGAVSDYLTSEPAYLTDQPAFTNAVAVIQTTLSPRELRCELQAIENAHGRVRTVANGPRTLDLDVVDYEGVTSEDPELVLPHPLACERDFVVTPLLSIMPNYVLADGAAVSHSSPSVGAIMS